MNDHIYLAHHGIKGMKWGVRRFQNEDGSLTSAGKARYNDDGTRKSIGQRISERRQAKQAATAEAMKPKDSDLKATKRVKDDWANLSDKEFKGKYFTNKKTYAKRVMKSRTGDPLADRKAKMSPKKYNKAVKRDVDLQASVKLSEAAKETNKSRSLGSRVTSTILLGGRGNTAYNTARASGMSKVGASLAVSMLGPDITMSIADSRYKNSAEGDRYMRKTASEYYDD